MTRDQQNRPVHEDAPQKKPPKADPLLYEDTRLAELTDALERVRDGLPDSLPDGLPPSGFQAAAVVAPPLREITGIIQGALELIGHLTRRQRHVYDAAAAHYRDTARRELAAAALAGLIADGTSWERPAAAKVAADYADALLTELERRRTAEGGV